MLKKVAELKLNKNKDYYKETVKALEKAGFILVAEMETFTEIFYIVAKESENEICQEKKQ